MGKLFYVIGASGAGKDSLMQYARVNQKSDNKTIFCHRYITRPADSGGENHIALSKQEFLLRKELDFFVLNWYSHGTYYGIGKEIDIWLKKGCNVIVNGSRGYLPEALKRYPEIKAILIKVKPSLLRERLIKRGRETKEDIEKRIQRAAEYADISGPKIKSFENNSDLSVTGPAFLKLITSE